MIYSTLAESARVENLHPQFKKTFDYIKSHDLFHAELGRIELDGDNLFINNVNPKLITAEEQVLEVHRDYLDIHIPLDAVEIIGIKPLADCKNLTQEYEKEKECGLYSDTPTNFIRVHPGEFLIVYPEDAHAPLIGEGMIRKLIVKIKL